MKLPWNIGPHFRQSVPRPNAWRALFLAGVLLCAGCATPNRLDPSLGDSYRIAQQEPSCWDWFLEQTLYNLISAGQTR